MLEKLKKTRESFGLSRKDIATFLGKGYSASQYERIETERPVNGVVYKIDFEAAQKLYKLFLKLAKDKGRVFDIGPTDLFR
jgi:transcriptional regulator with XRE-family HTH domain